MGRPGRPRRRAQRVLRREPSFPNTMNDPVSLADVAAVAAGVTVVASSGDAGPFNNIGSPVHNARRDRGRRDDLPTRSTARPPGTAPSWSPGGWENNNISALSSDGVTEFAPQLVDVVAPGDRGWSLCSSNIVRILRLRRHRSRCQPAADLGRRRHQRSAPEISGTAALVIVGLRASTHGGALPSPGAGRADHRQYRHRPRRAQPTIRAPGWSTRSRPSSSPSRSTAAARRQHAAGRARPA